MTKLEGEIKRLDWEFMDCEELIESYRQIIKSHIDDESLRGVSENILNYALLLDAEVRRLDGLYKQKELIERLTQETTA